MVLSLHRRKQKRTLVCTTACLMILTLSVNAFLRPAYSRHLMTRFHANKDDDELHFQDFDFVIGDEGDVSAPPDPLQKRIQEVKHEQVRKDAQLTKNWKTGNWKTRGFSLDKNDPLQQDDVQSEPVHVSRVQSSLTPNQVVVGRTDGSVCFVTLGTQYLTQFVGKLTATETSNATIQVQTELVRKERATSSENKPEEQEDPFKVVRQFRSHDSAIVALGMAENEELDQRLLFTAAQGSGEIRVWALPEDENAKVMPLRSLTDAHSDTIVALKTLSLSPDDEDDNNLLFSASCDGSVALWDVLTGDLVYKCNMIQDEEPARIQSADVDQSQSVIYLGMASGHVVGYNVEGMVTSASAGGACPVPSGRFMAQEGGVTALHCAGEGTLARSGSGTSSSILLTGGADGVVKQW